jgi:hypothetical protein
MIARLAKTPSARMVLWLVLLAALMVAAWYRFADRRRPAVLPANLEVIATELGSLAPFRQDLSPNSRGTALVFCQLTEKGIGIYFWDALSGAKRLVCEQEEQGYRWPNRYSMEGWAPDDSLFACAYPPHHSTPEEQILICCGTSGETLASLSVDTNLSELAWLTAQSFVYSTSTTNLNLCEQKPDGTWGQVKVFEKVGVERIRNLAALSTNSVAWQEGGDIWTMDVVSGAREKVWKSTTNRLEGFEYSRAAGEYLLNCSDSLGWFFIRYLPPANGRTGGTIVELSRIEENRPTYVFARIEDGLSAFHLKVSSNSEPIRLVWPGTVEGSQGSLGDYVLAGDFLYVTGNLTNQAPGIWQFDVRNKSLTCIVSSIVHPFSSATVVVPEVGQITSPLGTKNYHVWKPLHPSPGEKYPLILGQTPYVWLEFPQIAANGQCYFATVDRPYFIDNSITNWAEDVMSLYQLLKQDPSIDTSRVFLCAQSAETTELGKLVAQQPGRWKGILLFSPIGLPACQSGEQPRMLIVAGTGEPGAVERLTKYREEASRMGIPVMLVLQEGVQHTTKSISTERERARIFARFLLEN